MRWVFNCVLRLRCLAQGRCGVAVAGTVLLGIQEPRHVFRPPAGKYTFIHRVSRERQHAQNAWSLEVISFEAAGVWGACGKIFFFFLLSVHEDCTLPYTTWKLRLHSSMDWRVSIGFCSSFRFAAGYILKLFFPCFSQVIYSLTRF